MKRTSSLKRGRRKERPSTVSHTTAETVYRRTWGACVACENFANDLHHVFPKSKWPALRDEPDNLVAVCRKCHSEHEVARHRLPRSAIPCAERLATTPAMRDYLDRTYTVTAERAA